MNTADHASLLEILPTGTVGAEVRGVGLASASTVPAQVGAGRPGPVGQPHYHASARGAAATRRERQLVVKNCLRSRGYSVLN